jgi:ABC-type Fe3+-hydroxamate transport system substrate-binding protein
LYLPKLNCSGSLDWMNRFCVHPQTWFRNKTRVGGTKTLDIEKIRHLKPDLIVANKEENTKEDVNKLGTFSPVWTSDIQTLPDAFAMIRELGNITNRLEEGLILIRQIESAFSSILPVRKRSAYLIWKNPYMVAGGHTFINEMMKAAGMGNVFESTSRYPEVDIEKLQAANIELLLLSSEPYPFKISDIEELSKFLPQTDIRLVDGEMFSWYGSRMLKFPEYWNSLMEQGRPK